MWKIVGNNFDTTTKQRFPLKQQTEAEAKAEAEAETEAEALVENKPQNRTQKLIEKR